jgi:uncharacterized membrane protein
MYEVTDWKAHINIRLEEKRRFLNARKGASWLLLFVSGLIMFTLLRVSFLFSTDAIVLPAIFWVIVLVNAVAIYSLWKAHQYIKESELAVAAQLVQLSLVIGTFSLLLMIAGISEWLVELKNLPRMASGGLLVFLLFYMLNVIMSLFNLHSVYRKLKTYEIHSMNISSFQKAFSFSIFLVVSLIVFVLTVAL